MVKDIKALPENVDALKALVLSKEQMLLEKDQHIAVLQEQLRLALYKRFAASSEKSSPDQLNLFNEVTSDEALAVSATPDTTVSEDKRKKPGRRPLPDHIPRLRMVHDIPEDEKVCPCGCRKTCIGEETSEQLDIIPAKIQVRQHVRLKHACRDCEGVEDDGSTVTIAPMPPQPIPKSNASPDLLAHIVTAKFEDGLPLYRQEKLFARIGMRIHLRKTGNRLV